MSQTSNPKGFRPANPAAVPVYLPVATTQTLTKGDPVFLSSGKVTIAAATTAELAGIIAANVASPASGTLVPVWGVANPDEVFIGRMDATTSYVSGGDVDITGATGTFQLDADATSVNPFVLIAALPDDSAGAGQRWYCKINKSAFADTSS